MRRLPQTPMQLCAAAALILASGIGVAQAAPKVVVSIKPLHSLVVGVMAGVGEPTLLVQRAGSPHAYNLKPSEARALAQADLVFWIGEGMETFLTKPLDSLARPGTIVELAALDGIALLETREGGARDGHDDGHAAQAEDSKDHAVEQAEPEEHAAHVEHAHAHGEHDMHIWLDPDNAKAIVRAIVAALSAADPANAAGYEANGATLSADLAQLDSEIAAALAPVRGQPYIVFHDAYQYFEAHYGTNAVGAITVSPDRPPGAKRLAALRGKITDLGAACVFSEPQFEPALVATIVAGTAAKTGELDPLGAALPAGPQAYFELMRGLAAAMVKCLSPAS